MTKRACPGLHKAQKHAPASCVPLSPLPRRGAVVGARISRAQAKASVSYHCINITPAPVKRGGALFDILNPDGARSCAVSAHPDDPRGAALWRSPTHARWVVSPAHDEVLCLLPADHPALSMKLFMTGISASLAQTLKHSLPSVSMTSTAAAGRTNIKTSTLAALTTSSPATSVRIIRLVRTGSGASRPTAGTAV